MWAALVTKIKGWKTLIWSGILVALGAIGTIMAAFNGDMVAALLPDKYKPFAPMVLMLIGAITGGLRLITTGPVGDKGN